MNIVEKYVNNGKRETIIRMESEQITSEYEKAIQYIDQLIQQGNLQVGSKLPTERAIAEELGIGRNSTREALSILHGMGMIERVQGSGNYISKDAGGSIHRILRMMLALGTITGKEIADFRCMMEKAVCLDLLDRGLSEEQQIYFEEILQGMEAAPAEGFLEFDKTFHAQLIRATGNPLFILLLESVSDLYQEQIARVLQHMDNAGRREILTQHRAIYYHLTQKHKEAMLEAIDRHYIR